MSQKESVLKDTKATEEKALNYFKAFIEDSKVISQYLNDDDKEPCWDGQLYLYSDGIRDKNHFIGRVPVQIKGTEVASIITKDWKFKIEKNDLKAYLNEPTFFIVCQVKKDSKERKLFYREFLPDLVNKLIRDMGEHESRKTLFHPLTENLKEFEGQLVVFLKNSKKMVSFASAKTLTMADAVKRGIKEFSFVAPANYTDLKDLLNYLSTHDTYLYAKVSSDLDIDMPLSGGPARMTFIAQSSEKVIVGDRVFFENITSEIKDGRNQVTLSDGIVFDFPLVASDKTKPSLKMSTKAQFLKDAIKKAEFAIALADFGFISIGDLCLELASNELSQINDVRKQLVKWKELDGVLDKLHVTKSLDLTLLSQEHIRRIEFLIDTIGKGNTIKLDGQQSTIFTLDICNVTLLLWCAADTDGNCTFGDFFDKTIQISYTEKKQFNETILISPFSYLQNEHFWGRIDNIDYDSIVESAQEMASKHIINYQMSNLDVLAMISSADAISSLDVERSEKLLIEAMKLNEWLIENDPNPEMAPIHLINKLQIIKRQRELSVSEVLILEKIIIDKTYNDSVKVAAYLLLDNPQKALSLFKTLPNEEKKKIKEYPIWLFSKNSPR